VSERQPRPHPLNGDFQWVDRTVPLRRLTPDQRDAFNRLGFVRVEGVFSPTEVAEVIAAIDPFEAADEQTVREAGGTVSIATADVITFTTHLVKRSQTLKTFAGHRFFKDLCHDLLADDVRLYWDQSVYKKTGKVQEFPWHQDNGYTFHRAAAVFDLLAAAGGHGRGQRLSLDRARPAPGGHAGPLDHADRLQMPGARR